MSPVTRHNLIFGHEGNARAAASVVLVGVLAALIGSVFMAIGPRFKQEPRPIRDAYIGESSAQIRIVGHAPRENGTCEQQVWPNIDQRCLVRTEPAAKPGGISPSEQNNKPPQLTTTSTAMNRLPSTQDAANGDSPYYATTPAPPRQDALNVSEPSDRMENLPDDDDVGELRQQQPIEPPRKRSRRYYRPFHFHFGAFRF